MKKNILLATLIAGFLTAALTMASAYEPVDVDNNFSMCASCHGPNGAGGSVGPKINDKPVGFCVSNATAIARGKRTGGKSATCKAMIGRLTDAQIAAACKAIKR